VGVIIVPAGSFCIYKIYRGSKSGFAYTLMAFTLLDGVQFIAQFLTNTFPQTISIGDNKQFVVNEYAFLTTS
jgi:hypothetical protein